MGLLDNQKKGDYYNSNDFGGYQFVSLEDIINQFMVVYVGEDKIIPRARRLDVAFHAQRALAELSFDTFKSTKSQEIEVPDSLTMVLPHDYVNYTKLSWVDDSGIEHVIYPARKTSNPKAIKQDADLDRKYRSSNEDGNYDLMGQSVLSKGDFTDLGTLTGGNDSLYAATFNTGSVPAAGVTPSTPWYFYNSDNGSGVFGGWSYDSTNGVMQATNVDGGYFIHDYSGFADGQKWTLVYTISDYSGSGNIQPRIVADQGYYEAFTARSANGTYTETITFDFSTGTQFTTAHWNRIHFKGNGDFTGKIDDVKLVLGEADGLTYQTTSDTWDKYKGDTPNENTINDFSYDEDVFDLNIGQRYGLNPSHAQTNGSFFIDENVGKIHFSSNISGKTVILKYISDSLGTDAEMKVHKLAEDAMYKHMLCDIMSARRGVPANAIFRYKKDKFAAVRKAKLRLSNIKIEEITQVLRGKSKWIKH